MIKIIKLGGTIINHDKYKDKVLELINNEMSNKNKLIIVVSAIGREGEPYSTASLSSLGENLDSKNKAELLSYGERLSSLTFLNTLLHNRINAVSLRINEIGIILDSNYLDGNLIELNNQNLKDKLDNYDVVIVPGFIGINKNNETVLLGKGGSDLTAIYLAKMLDIKEINLYKDVNGIMSGDPKIIADPITIEHLDYDESLVFAECGASIVQKKAILVAKKEKIIINIYSIDSLEKKSIISNQKSDLEVKGVMSIDSIIYIIGDEKKINYKNVCKLLEFYNFNCKNNIQTPFYYALQIEGGKRNFAMNVIHHHFISKNFR